LDFKSSKRKIGNKCEQKILFKIGLEILLKKISIKREQKIMLKIGL